MASQCVHFLDQADIVNALSSHALGHVMASPADTLAGRILQTLIGYDDRPSIMQAIAYLATLAAIFGAMRMFAPSRLRAHAPAAVGSQVAAE